MFGGTGLVTVDGKGRVLLASGSFVSGAGAADAARLTAGDAVALVADDVAPYDDAERARAMFGGTGLVTIDGKGRVLVASGSFVAGAGAADAARLTAGEAVALVTDDVAPYDEAERARRLGAKDGTVTFENTLAVPDYDGAPVAAELVTVGTAEGPRTAWQVQADRASNASYVVLVDAVTGEVLVRQNQLSEDNQGTVFQGEDPEAGGRSQIVFPAGWATAGDTTSGNNVNAYQDAAGDNSAQAADQPHDADRHWNYTWNDPWGASVAGAEADLPLAGADRDAVVTQLFYYTNWYHDYAYDLGFTETARNFQNDNFGHGGTGGDAVEAESDANFTGEQCDDGGNAGQVPQQRELQRQRRRRHQAADADVRRRHQPRRDGPADTAGQQPRHDHPRVHPRHQRADHLQRQPGRRHPVQLAG